MAKRVRQSPSAEDEDLEGLTAEEDSLFTAISFGKLHRVASLLPRLRSTEVRDDFSNTPLIHATRNAREDHVNFLVKLLLQSGSDVNAQDDAGMTSLMHLIRRGDAVDALRTLVRCKQCDPDLKDKKGNTALMYAAKFGNAEALAILLFQPAAAKLADVNARNQEGFAALDFAVMEHQAVCAQMLVEKAKADTRTVKDSETFKDLIREGLSHRDVS